MGLQSSGISIKMPTKYADILGHFNFEKVYARQVRSAPDNNKSRFLEIGCYLGKSTIFMAECIRESGKDITLHVVDTFGGEGMSADMSSFQDTFMENIRKCDVEDLICVHPGKSEQVVPTFPDEHFDFIFIDGLHTYEAVSSDIKNSLRKLRSGGVLAGHDYQHEPVRRAVHDCLGRSNIKLHRNTWIYNKHQK